VFKGNFKNNKKHGEGLYIHPNGETHRTLHKDDQSMTIGSILGTLSEGRFS